MKSLIVCVAVFVAMAAAETSTATPAAEIVKQGKCPAIIFDSRNDTNATDDECGYDTCTTDNDCDGIDKCCSDGCDKMCVPALSRCFVCAFCYSVQYISNQLFSSFIDG